VRESSTAIGALFTGIRKHAGAFGLSGEPAGLAHRNRCSKRATASLLPGLAEPGGKIFFLPPAISRWAGGTMISISWSKKDGPHGLRRCSGRTDSVVHVVVCPSCLPVVPLIAFVRPPVLSEKQIRSLSNFWRIVFLRDAKGRPVADANRQARREPVLRATGFLSTCSANLATSGRPGVEKRGLWPSIRPSTDEWQLGLASSIQWVQARKGVAGLGRRQGMEALASGNSRPGPVAWFAAPVGRRTLMSSHERL